MKYCVSSENSQMVMFYYLLLIFIHVPVFYSMFGVYCLIIYDHLPLFKLLMTVIIDATRKNEIKLSFD